MATTYFSNEDGSDVISWNEETRVLVHASAGKAPTIKLVHHDVNPRSMYAAINKEVGLYDIDSKLRDELTRQSTWAHNWMEEVANG